MFWTDVVPEQTIGDALAGAASRFGDQEAFTFPGARLSLRDADARSDRFASACLKLGIRRGDRVAILMASHAEWVEIYFGLAKIGAVMVPLNTRFKPGEIEFGLKKAGVTTLIFRSADMSDHDYGGLLLEVLPELRDSKPGQLQARRVPTLRAVIDLAEAPIAGTLDYGEFLELSSGMSSDQLQAAKRAVAPRDEVLVQYTSGTTAFPKGAQLHHAGMLHGAARSITGIQMKAGDGYFAVQPFYHSGGTVGTMLTPVVSGCRAITQTYFDTGEALDIMESERANVMVGHQPHFIEYLNHPSFPKRRLSLERLFVIAPPEVLWMVREKTGIDALVSGYGMTESHLDGTYTSLSEPMELRFNTNGRPTPGTRLEIRDPDDGRVLGPDSPGEIFLQVQHPMIGYLDEPQITRDVLDEDGWYRSGDQGTIDKDGYLRLLGRVRDMIRVGGENLAGAEVEACLLEHPAVKQVAVIAAPDPRLGEVVVAFIELKQDQSASEQALIDHCRSRLASFKAPRQVQFVTDWPMSGTGKIQKRLLTRSASQASDGSQRK